MTSLTPLIEAARAAIGEDVEVSMKGHIAFGLLICPENFIKLCELVFADIQRQLGDIQLDTTMISIETKSFQNYKSEWEIADFRASVDVNT